MESGKVRSVLAILLVGLGLALSSCVVYDAPPYYVDRGPPGHWHKPHGGWHDNGWHGRREGWR